MPSFTLTIELGNAEMSTPLHVSLALVRIAYRLANVFNDFDDYRVPAEGSIMDANGNTVGHWEVRQG